MRTIGYFVDCFPSVSETFVLNEILEVSRRGINVVVFSLARPCVEVAHPGAKELAQRTIYLDDYPLGKFHTGLRGALRFKAVDLFRMLLLRITMPHPYGWIAMKTAPLISRIRQVGCERFHAHFAGPACQWAFVISRILGVPFGFTAHRYDIFVKPPERFELLIGSADICVTVSNYNKNYLIGKWGDVARKFAVIMCGTDTERFRPSSPSIRMPGQLLTVGRLSPEKGYKYLIEAANILKNLNINFNWLIVGEGSDRHLIESMILSYGLSDRVTLMGAKSSTEVIRLLASSQMFVLASTHESAGMVYQEAMATETPIVGTKVMGVPECVPENIAGVLVPPADAHALAIAIQRLLFDDLCCKHMGEEGRKHVVANLCLKGQVSKLISLWDASQPNNVSSH